MEDGCIHFRKESERVLSALIKTLTHESNLERRCCFAGGGRSGLPRGQSKDHSQGVGHHHGLCHKQGWIVLTAGVTKAHNPKRPVASLPPLLPSVQANSNEIVLASTHDVQEVDVSSLVAVQPFTWIGEDFDKESRR